MKSKRHAAPPARVVPQFIFLSYHQGYLLEWPDMLSIWPDSAPPLFNPVGVDGGNGTALAIVMARTPDDLEVPDDAMRESFACRAENVAGILERWRREGRRRAVRARRRKRRNRKGW